MSINTSYSPELQHENSFKYQKYHISLGANMIAYIRSTLYKIGIFRIILLPNSEVVQLS